MDELKWKPYQLTRLELEHLYNVLTSVKSDDATNFDEELDQAIEIVQETLHGHTPTSESRYY